MQPQRRFERGPLRSSLVVHVSWLPAGALLSAHLAFSAYGDRRLVPAVSLAVVTVVAFFGCVLVHGYAHVVAARTLGAQGLSGRLFVFGDVIDHHDTMPGGRRGVLISLAGPIASAVLGAASLAGTRFAEGTAADLLRATGLASLAVAAVNLLPGLPLDGGRVVQQLTGSVKLGVRAGRVLGLVATVVGIWLLLGGPAALAETALGLWLVLAGIFIQAEARQPLTTYQPKVAIENETVAAWARAFRGRLDANDPVPHEPGPYAVSDNGRLAGVLTSDARPGVRTGDVMVPWSGQLGMRASAPVGGALERLADRTAPIIVVVDEKGIVRGVLDEVAVRARLAGA